MPCPAGRFYSSFDATKPSDCPLCPANWFAPSGASACTPCGNDQTSSAGAATCDPCVPSAFSVAQFKCYTAEAQVLVICGYILSVLSSLFSMYKLRIFVRERVDKLVAAGIKPTLKHVVFLDRALRSHSKRERQLLSITEPAASFDMNGSTSSPARDGEDVGLMRDFQLQMQQTQQEMKQQFETKLTQQQQQQQQTQQEMKQQQLLLQQQLQAVQDQLLALQIKLQQST